MNTIRLDRRPVRRRPGQEAREGRPGRVPSATRRSTCHRALAVVLMGTMSLLGCPLPGVAMAPIAGRIDYQRDAIIAFRHGEVDAIGGNLRIERTDLSLDTRLGRFDARAVWNSASGEWRWTFDMERRGPRFVDDTGRSHRLDAIADGAALPGTIWVEVDDSTMKTKGGLVHAFESDGPLAAIHWSGRAFPRLSFTSADFAGRRRVVAIDQCTATSTCTPIYTITRDAVGHVVAIDDRAGRRAEFTWTNGELVGAKDGLDVAEGRPGFRYTYASGRIDSLVNGEGERTEFAYSGDRVAEIREIGEQNPVQRFYYEARSEGLWTTRHFDALGIEHVYRYDAGRRLIRKTNVASGLYEAWTWSGLRPTSHRDRAGAITQWTWSFDDDATTELTPSGNLIRTTYAPDAIDRDDPTARPIARIEDALGLIEARSHRADGLLETRTNGAGETWRYAYELDWGGTITAESVTTPSGATIYSAGFDESGHALYASTGDLGSAQLRLYDVVGNQTGGLGVGDGLPPGGVDSFEYDEDRGLRRLRMQDGSTIEIDVRSDGRRLTVRRPNGGDHTTAYDALGRPIATSERVDGVLASTFTVYDAAGRPAWIGKSNGMQSTYAYDAEGRIQRLRIARHSTLEGEATFHYVAGRLDAITDSIRGTTEAYDYDGAGRPIQIHHGDGSRTRFEYDLRSRVIRREFVAAGGLVLRTLDYAYDGADREVEILENGRLVLARTYVQGQPRRIDYGNGLTRWLDYETTSGVVEHIETRDALGRLVEESTLDSSKTTNAIEFRLETTTFGAVPATTLEVYTVTDAFDPALSELARGGRVTGWSDGVTPMSLAYDTRSNLLAKGAMTLAYNPECNRLVSATPVVGPALTYQYDESGYVTSRAGVPLTWTANGRLASHGDDHFEWDTLGRPISSTVDGVTTTSLFGGAVTGDAFGQPTAIDLGEAAIDLATGARHYRHEDLRRNVKFTTDDQGRVTAHYGYSPYGIDVVHGSSADAVRFAGRREIGELMILGERIYDPAVGRFLSPDPILNDVNQYAYATGDPVRFWDPDGRIRGSDVLTGIGLAFGLLAAIVSIFAPPVAAVFSAIAIQHFIWAFVVRLAEEHDSGGGALKPGVDSEGGFSGSDISGGGLTCAPTASNLSNELPAKLATILLLQALLGFALRRRRRSRMT